jgi:hypothetical protein
MSQALWIVKKNIIRCKIKKISAHYGNDNIDWLKDYTEEVVRVNPHELDKIITALQDMEKYCFT